MHKTTGILRINNVRVWAHHGYYEEERKLGGEYQIDVVIQLDCGTGVDQLSDTINYESVVSTISLIMKKEYLLIEESCSALYDAIYDSKMDKLEVTVTKLSLPINNVESTSYTITSS